LNADAIADLLMCIKDEIWLKEIFVEGYVHQNNLLIWKTQYLFTEEAVKVKWTGLGNNFGKELKKLVSLDWETMLHSRWLSGYISRFFMS
jgi:hypothetical protein